MVVSHPQLMLHIMLVPQMVISVSGKFPNIATTYTTTASTADWLARLVPAVLQILGIRSPMPQYTVGILDQRLDSPQNATTTLSNPCRIPQIQILGVVPRMPVALWRPLCVLGFQLLRQIAHSSSSHSSTTTVIQLIHILQQIDIVREGTLPGTTPTSVIRKELVSNIIIQPDDNIIRQERELLPVRVVSRVSLLLWRVARCSTATTVAVVQLAVPVHVVVLQVVQNIPDIGRRLFSVTIMQSNPPPKVRTGLLLLLAAAVLLIQIPGVVSGVMPHETLQLPVMEVRFPIGGRVGPLDLDVARAAADVLSRHVVGWRFIVPGT